MNENRPFPLLPLISLLLLVTPGGRGLTAQSLSIEAMGGTAYNFPTPLTVRQSGFPDIHLTAHYDTRPFGPYTPYYAWRLSLWNGAEGWELEQVHHRLFLANTTTEVTDFSVHFGYNYLLLGHAWRRHDFTFHLDAGPILTNPENTVRGLKLRTRGTGLFDSGYYLSGFGGQAGLSRNFYFSRNAFVVLDAALMAAWATVPVVNGSADVPTIGVHGHVGVGWSR
jgi:hypothetical protein